MNCRQWHLDIIEQLDAALSKERSDQVEAHVRSCPRCATFRAEQRSLQAHLEAERRIQLEPRQELWARIETRLPESQPHVAQPVSWSPFDLFRQPQFSYGLAALVLLALTAIVGIQTGEPDREFLAQLDAFDLEVTDNPFLATMEDQNPFFNLEGLEPENPFENGGTRQ